MGNADWSVDHRELDSTDEVFSLRDEVSRPARRSSDWISPDRHESLLRCVNGALRKAAESLERQNELRRELSVVRDELLRVRGERDALLSERMTRLHELERENASLRRERKSLRKILEKRNPAVSVPPEEFLILPLVLRSRQDEFLGIADRCGHAMSLSDFLLLVERGGSGERIVGSLWERSDPSWCLTLSVSSPAHMRCLTLEFQPYRTPNGNLVSLLQTLFADGVPASRGWLLRMFRQLRASLQA